MRIWHHHHDGEWRLLFCVDPECGDDPDYEDPDGHVCDGRIWSGGRWVSCRFRLVWREETVSVPAVQVPLFPHVEAVPKVKEVG